MATTRVMNGLAEFLPGQGVGHLKVQQMISRRPEPKYEVKCDVCNTLQVVTHTQLRNESARCKFSGCGKPAKTHSRDLLSETRQQIANREAERLAEERETSERRMAAEADGYERPDRYAPKPAPPVMTERERQSLRQYREEQEAEQREAERPLLEAERRAAERREAAESVQREREEKLRAYWSQAVQEAPDPKLFVTPELLTAAMPTKEASAHNVREVEKFISTTPEFAEYKTPANSDKLTAYFDRNGVRIFDAAMLKAAFERLKNLGILEKHPAPLSAPEERPRRVNLTVEPVPKAPSRPKTYVGRDFATGQERTFTQREVDRMSSTEYRRAFPVLGSVSELFTVLSDERR